MNKKDYSAIGYLRGIITELDIETQNIENEISDMAFLIDYVDDSETKRDMTKKLKLIENAQESIEK